MFFFVDAFFAGLPQPRPCAPSTYTLDTWCICFMHTSFRWWFVVTSYPYVIYCSAGRG